ncbi:MAG: hypothetical protein ABR924_00180 [Terracidiphilus sp.]|jgi:hypothetical protein
MKNQQIVLLFFASLMAASGAAAQTLDWQAVEKLSPRTWISVETQKRTECSFQRATDDMLYCEFQHVNWMFGAVGPKTVHVFDRAEIREVRIVYFDYSSRPPSLLFALEGGGGLDSTHQASSFAGVKVSGPIGWDLKYDRIQGNNGCSFEYQAMLPILRIPRFRGNNKNKFLRLYAEPGLGYRGGGGPFGGYSSAKVMAVLLPSKWLDSPGAPYVEFQRRFPFESPLRGDNRLTFGVIVANW